MSNDLQRQFASLILDSLGQGEAIAMVTVVHADHGTGATLGAKLLVDATSARGSLGHPELDAFAIARARSLLQSTHPQTLLWPEAARTALGTKVECYLEIYAPASQLVICGAGHIAVPLARMAKICGFRVTVIDDRPEYANPARFPEADQIFADDFIRSLQRITITPSTSIVLVTRGHRYDWDCLCQVIDSKASYIGMIGSRRRVQAAFLGLLERGVDRKCIERVHAPIGLDIGAETPEEIAVCILAEIVLHRRGGTGQPLRTIARVLEKIRESETSNDGS